MTKKTKDKQAQSQSNPDSSQKKVSKKGRAQFVKRMLRVNNKSKVKPILKSRIIELLSEPAVECPICLQVLLGAVLAECGHTYCLECAQGLARSGYGCGICPQFQPSFNLNVHMPTQRLINRYLEKCSQDEVLNYQKRYKIFLQNQAKRQISDDVNEGSYVDFWSLSQKRWIDKLVIKVQGKILTLTKNIRIHRSCRKIACFRTFTTKPQKAQNKNV